MERIKINPARADAGDELIVTPHGSSPGAPRTELDTGCQPQWDSVFPAVLTCICGGYFRLRGTLRGRDAPCPRGALSVKTAEAGGRREGTAAPADPTPENSKGHTLPRRPSDTILQPHPKYTLRLRRGPLSHPLLLEPEGAGSLILDDQ